MTLELQSFDSSRLYSPSEQRAIKANNAAYYEEQSRLRKASERKEAEAKKKPKLTEDEIFALRVKEDEARKAEFQAREDFQAGLVKQHEEYLNSDVQRAAICCNSLASFIREQNHWLMRGYSVELETLDAQLPSLFVCYMLAPEKPAKTSKK